MGKSASNKNYSATPPPDLVASPIQLVVPEECAGLRLDQALARLLPEHSRSRLADWARAGRVTVEGETAAPRLKLMGGERLAVSPAPCRDTLAYSPEDIELRIIHEDDAILVIDKPPGLVVHPGSGNWHGTLLNALLQHVPAATGVPRAGIVHRLDKDTSGLMVVAKTVTAHTDLVRQLQARTVFREYAAVAHGSVEADGVVDAPLGRHPVSRIRMAVVARGKPAVTHYRIVQRLTDATLLACRLETGRTHQIRVHLASIGHAILGDAVYAPRASRALPCTLGRQALHARRLGLVHPVTRRDMTWRVDPPEDMQALISALTIVR